MSSPPTIYNQFQLYDQYQAESSQFIDWTQVYNYTNTHLTANFLELLTIADIYNLFLVKDKLATILIEGYFGIPRSNYITAVNGGAWDIGKYDNAIWDQLPDVEVWSDFSYKQLALNWIAREQYYIRDPFTGSPALITRANELGVLSIQEYENIIAQYCLAPFYFRLPNQLQNTNLYYFGAGNPNNTTNTIPAGWQSNEPLQPDPSYTFYIITTTDQDFQIMTNYIDNLPKPGNYTIILKKA